MDLQPLILEAWNNRELLKEKKYIDAVKAVIEEVDKGRLRTASPTENGWHCKRMGKAGYTFILCCATNGNNGNAAV